MIEYKTNKDNENYIMMTKLNLICTTLDFDIPSDIRDEAMNILLLLSDYEKEEKCASIKEIAISKNDGIGEFLSTCELSGVRTLDFDISYEKIVNAFNIATYENNPIAEELLKLFLKQESGSVEDLKTKYKEEVLEYIIINNDFKSYIAKQNDTYEPKQFIVYEDGNIINKILDPKNKNQNLVRKLK